MESDLRLGEIHDRRVDLLVFRESDPLGERRCPSFGEHRRESELEDLDEERFREVELDQRERVVPGPLLGQVEREPLRLAAVVSGNSRGLRSRNARSSGCSSRCPGAGPRNPSRMPTEMTL